MNLSSPSSVRYCSQCGSPLLLVESKTELLDGHFAPTTVNTYKCSDPSCQAEKDRQTEKRMKLAKEKEEAAEKRTKAKLEQKRHELSEKL